jgi:hypothetical protein
VELSHCWHASLVMVWDEARLRRGNHDQSCRGHQCSETMLTGGSRFHMSTPLVIEPGSLMTGSKHVNQWTSGTVYERSEIAGSPQTQFDALYVKGLAEKQMIQSYTTEFAFEKLLTGCLLKYWYKKC